MPEKYFALHLKDQVDVELAINMEVRLYEYDPSIDTSADRFGKIVGFVGTDYLVKDDTLIKPKILVQFWDGTTGAFDCDRADQYSDWGCNDIVVL